MIFFSSSFVRWPQAVEAIRQAERVASQWQKKAEQAESQKEEFKERLFYSPGIGLNECFFFSWDSWDWDFLLRFCYFFFFNICLMVFFVWVCVCVSEFMVFFGP